MTSGWVGYSEASWLHKRQSRHRNATNQNRDAPEELVRVCRLCSAQARSDGLSSKCLRVGLPAELALRLLQVALRGTDLAAQQPGDAARSEEMRGRQGRVRELLGVEGVRVRVAIFAGDEPDGRLNELQEQIILCPALCALELLAG